MCVLFLWFINPFNTAVAATGLLWYGGVFRITFVSDFVSDVSDVLCFGRWFRTFVFRKLLFLKKIENPIPS